MGFTMRRQSTLRGSTVQVEMTMSEKGAAWQNSYAECVIRMIKEGEVGLSEYRTYAEAYGQLRRLIHRSSVYTHGFIRRSAE